MKRIEAFQLGHSAVTEEGEVTVSITAEDGEEITLVMPPRFVAMLAPVLMRAEVALHRTASGRRELN
jgi:hypothetical protein